MTSPHKEHWSIDVGDADVAFLDIPPALHARDFLVDVRFVVRCPTGTDAAWHALTVEFDGSRQWSRRIATSNPGQTDSLDYQRGVELPGGTGLRVRAVGKTHAATPQQLRIEAHEQ